MKKLTPMELIKITDDGKKKTSELVKELEEMFHVSFFLPRGVSLDKDFPHPKSPTSRFFRDTQEPDEETLGQSYREIEKRGFISECMTIRERLIFEKVYFEKHGEHPDKRGWTITGSRNSDSHVPGVDWFPDSCEVVVDCYALGGASSSGGVRRAVSVSLETQNHFSEKRTVEAQEDFDVHFVDKTYKYYAFSKKLYKKPIVTEKDECWEITIFYRK